MAVNLKKWLGSEGMSQRVIRDFLGLLAERGGRFAVGFVVTGIVARHLGANLFGELSYGLAIGMIGAGIAQLGLGLQFGNRPDNSEILFKVAKG